MKILHVAKLLGVNTNGIDNVVRMLFLHQSKSNAVSVDVFDTSMKNSFSSFFRLRKFDLIIFHSIFCVKTWIYIYICILNKIPYVIVPHSGLTKASLNKSKMKKKAVMSIFLKRFIKKSAGVHFLNVDEKDNSLQCYSNSFIVPNGVCVPELKNKVTEHERYLAFLGRYDLHHKGIDILLEAVNQLKKELRDNGIHLRMHGHDKDGHSEEYIKSFISDNGLSDLILLRGPIFDNEEKVNYLRNASAYILTSRYEGLPITVLEGLSVDTPCLITKETNVAQVIETNNFGLTCRANVEDVVDMLRRYINNISFDIGYNPSRDYMITNYSWNVICRQLLEEYEKVARYEQ